MRRAWMIIFLFGCSSTEPIPKPLAKPAAQSKPAEAAQDLPPGTGLPRTIPPDPRYYAPAEAPDPLSCREDKDCISDTIVDTQSGCCIVESDPLPQTWSWHAWVAEHRMAGNCHEVKCKAVAVPDSLPKACLLEARCNSGRCGNTCQTGDAGVK